MVLHQGHMLQILQIYDFIRSVFDGSYFKIKQLQLDTLFQKSILARTGLDNLRVYFSLEDWFTFTDYPGFDPK